MKIGPKYKIARRLGASVFEKTQTQKFALSQQKRSKDSRPSRSNYGIQLNEKQKVRFTYGITEKQFAKYIREVIAKNPKNPSEMLFQLLESRLDNVVLKAGFASTRSSARQMVSHGHITLNGERVNVPSIQVKTGDVVAIRENSKGKALFNDLEERNKNIESPTWLKIGIAKGEISVLDLPHYSTSEKHDLNLPMVIQFYKR